METRPANCRERLKDEGKPYGRSGCAVCGSLLGKVCPVKVYEGPVPGPITIVDLEPSAIDQTRSNAIKDCVTWLAINNATYKPEFLAGELARALLPEGAT
ncbi:hypothetical protein [uncultured Roseibium sp.]|uniref:hypothetical protein n=1 Tax=uncultured Roseibium sp. TaxID=1936171 RepID=UPI00262DE193|nr:hypothetical protein [uncultured Roseibium sp.]